MATTTPKPAAKKTTTTKKTTTIKKTTTAKTATKKTTTAKPAKPAAPKATEISVTGNKKISTLCKEFNQKFPYLLLAIFDKDPMELKKKSIAIKRLDPSKTIASVRKAGTSGEISISGNKIVKNLEKEFLKVFGLYAQVCMWSSTDPNYVWFTNEGSSWDSQTLASLNSNLQKDGRKKGNWPAKGVTII